MEIYFLILTLIFEDFSPLIFDGELFARFHVCCFVYPLNSTADLLTAQLSNFSKQNSKRGKSSPSKISGLKSSKIKVRIQNFGASLANEIFELLSNTVDLKNR